MNFTGWKARKRSDSRMTALVFALQPDQVCVAMDTLVVAADDRLPMTFQRKFLSVPESNLLVAGTGHAGFITGWFNYLRAKAPLGDVDVIGAISAGVLKASADAAGGLGALATTLYHYGFSHVEGRYVGYAFRSKNDFRSERLPYALGLKPPVSVPPCDNIQFPNFMIDVVLRQQDQDRNQPMLERVGIGGEIEFVVLTGQTTTIATVHRFESYEWERQYIEKRGQ